MAKKLCHESGRRDKITSPVSGSCRMKTSLPAKRNCEGRRTAWLLPLRNSFAVRAMKPSRFPQTVWYIPEYITNQSWADEPGEWVWGFGPQFVRKIAYLSLRVSPHTEGPAGGGI